ncbi:MAG: tetratricopeptide repeat protein [Candidatus Eisenbacteria bacterium]
MRAERFHGAVIALLTAVVFATHLLGVRDPGTFWGADFYAFLPPAALIAACVLLAAVWVLALARPAAFDRLARSLPAPAGRATPLVWLTGAVTSVLFFAMCWLFREGHTLLGDANSLVHDLPQGQRFHPHEPITYLVHHEFYRLAGRWFAAGAADPTQVAGATVALSVALAGALFVPVAWGIACELSRRVDPDPAETTATRDTQVVPLFVILLAQGYVQLFFGHLENYTFNILVLGVYLWTTLRHLRGAAPLALPGMALVLEMSLDLSAVLLVPSFLVLVTRALMTPGRRLATARDLMVVTLVAASLTALMAWVQPGYNMAGAAAGLVLQAVFARGAHTEAVAYMLSRAHVRDFLNEQMLIGPAAAFLFATCVVWIGIARSRLTAATVFFLTAAVVSLGGAWVTTDLGLGYARDWDLFAPSALVFTVAGLHLALSGAWSGPALRRWLVLIACVSLFHTVPWVAVNASFDRSFDRFKTLRLGLGRTQAVVGSYYLMHADTTAAIPWLERSLEEYPGNNFAAYLLGRIAVRRGMYRLGAQAFWTALRSRPDKDEYRFALVDAIVRGGGPPALAKLHLDTLRVHAPDEPVVWAATGVVWLGLGERDSAASAFAEARRLAPDDTLFATWRPYLDAPDGYPRAVRERWPALVAR